MICENCKKEHDGSFGAGIFCSNDCAVIFRNTEMKNELDKVTSDSRWRYRRNQKWKRIEFVRTFKIENTELLYHQAAIKVRQSFCPLCNNILEIKDLHYVIDRILNHITNQKYPYFWQNDVIEMKCNDCNKTFEYYWVNPKQMYLIEDEKWCSL